MSYQVVPLNCATGAELEKRVNEFSDAGWRVVAVLGDLDHTQHVVLEREQVAPVSHRTANYLGYPTIEQWAQFADLLDGWADFLGWEKDAKKFFRKDEVKQ